MAMNSEYRGSASGMAAAKKKTAARKTVVTPGTKVSQATIDKIKAMGMTKALKSAGSASPEMREGLKRLYGAKRVAAAAPSKPAAKSPDQARGAMKVASKSVYKSADAARAAMPGKGPMVDATAKAAAKQKDMIAKSKKSGTTDPFAKAVFSIGKALKGGDRMTAAQVAAENKRRLAAIAAAKKNK